jgi:hypothetical protein
MFSFDDAMRSVSMLAFCFGPEGAAIFAPMESLVRNAEKRLDWMRRASAANNPPNNPYQQVIRQIESKIDDEDIKDDIRYLRRRGASKRGPPKPEVLFWDQMGWVLYLNWHDQNSGADWSMQTVSGPKPQ